jgi:hypothetical protein
MKNKIFSIDIRDTHEQAEKTFLSVTGLSGGEKNPELWEAGFTVRDAVAAKIKPRAVVSYAGGVYGYVLTIGEIGVEGGILEEVYADYWGTAYAVAAMERLRKILTEITVKEYGGSSISRAHDPGIRGMALDKMEDVFALADGGLIGVRYNERFMMSPRKSMCGFIYALDGDPLETDGCGGCEAAKSGCMLCRRMLK